MRSSDLFTGTGFRIIVFAIAMAILYYGRILFIPMSYGLFIAIVMYPMTNWLEKRKWNRTIAVTLSLTLVTALFALLLGLLYWEIRVFQQDLPDLKEKLAPSLAEFQAWVEKSLGYTIGEQNEWIRMQGSGIGTAGLLSSGFLRTLTNNLFILFIIPVFAALFLYNRGTFAEFVRLLAGDRYRAQMDMILKETVHTYFRYIRGMIFVYIIVGALNSAGLLALGVRHAVMFGFLTAVMTIIPYAGIIVSALLPISVAWIDTGAVWVPLGVVAVFAFVQYLEANVIFPRVVGAQLNVSTWAMLVFIIAGGIIWGVSGMVLFIPVAGMLKILSGHFEEMRSWKILLSR